MFATLANALQAGKPIIEGIQLSWQRRATAAKTSQRAQTQSQSAKRRNAATKPAPPEKNQAQVVAEAAVDLPVGAVLSVSDRVSELVEPFTGRAGAEKQLKSYRTAAAPNR